MSQQSSYTDFMHFDKAMLSAGLSEPQAKAIADFVRASKEYDLLKLTTKDETQLLEQKVDHIQADLNQKIGHNQTTLTQKIDFVSVEIQTQMAKQDSQQKVWMMATLLAIIGIIIGFGTAIFLKLS